MQEIREKLKGKKYFVLDMDGTFYLGDSLLEGSLEFIEAMDKKGLGYLFFTNNSSRSSEFYIDKLLRMGLDLGDGEVITSGMVSSHYLNKHHPGARVYLLGTPILREEFIKDGINLVEEHPDIVVAAFDTTISYETLTKACDFVRYGAKFIATHPDFNCPTEDGFIPDCGAICAFITASTDKLPRYLGKPHKETLDYILDYLSCDRDELVFIGDRLYTDIAIAANHGVFSILVLSGETKAQDIESSSFKPDLVLDRLIDLIDFI